MSENLHPKYIIELNDIDGESWGVETAPGSGISDTVGAIRFYPSGLILYCGREKHHTIYQPGYQPVFDATSGYVSNLSNMADASQLCFLSPVPKIYEFFDIDNNLLYKINYTDFVYDENLKLYKAPTTITKDNPYFKFNNKAVHSILFIDPLLGQYKDNISSANPEVYPIYKDNNNNYYLNNNDIIGDNYSFLSNIGALIEYNNQNLLQYTYPILSNIESSNKKYDLTINDIVNNTFVRPQEGEIHYRYGTQNKASSLMASTTENHLQYRENSNYLLQQFSHNYTKEHPLLLTEWVDPGSNYSDGVGTCRDCIMLDDYHLMLLYHYNNIRKIFRIPPKGKVSLYVRRNSDKVSGSINDLEITGPGSIQSGIRINAIEVACEAQSGIQDYVALTERKGIELHYTTGSGENSTINRDSGRLEEDQDSVCQTTDLLGSVDFQINARIYTALTLPVDDEAGAVLGYIDIDKLKYKLTIDHFPGESTNIGTYIEKPTNPNVNERTSNAAVAFQKREADLKGSGDYYKYGIHTGVEGIFMWWIPDASTQLSLTTYIKYPGISIKGNKTLFTNPNYETYDYGKTSITNDYATGTNNGTSAGMSLRAITLKRKSADTEYSAVGIYPDTEE